MRGRDKLLEKIDDTPILLRQLHICLATTLPVLATLPPDSSARHAVISAEVSSMLTITPIPDAATGISASLRAGGAWATNKGYTGLMIVLPDMPGITTPDLQKVAQLHNQHPSDVIRACDANGNHGHPTLIPARLFPSIAKLHGDRGARDVLQTQLIRNCPLSGDKALTDLDTPEDWAAWRERQTKPG